jgi:uncharacterized protein (UPF0147 family)
MTETENIIELLEEIKKDESTNANLKSKLSKAINIMKQELDVSIKVSKTLQQLEGIIEQNNIAMHLRTDLWTIFSLLETL